MIIRLMHKLGLVKGIYLVDNEGEIYKTWKTKEKFEDFYTAYIYPFNKIRRIILHEDGTASFFNGVCYIEKWYDMD